MAMAASAIMEYRKLPHGGEDIGVVGMGTSMVGDLPEKEIVATVEHALNAGVNYFDMAGGRASIFPAFGKALERRREEVLLQIHFGADYSSGEYGWTLDLEKVKRSVDWQLGQLRSDYIDFGFIHCLDETRDLEAYERHGILAYLLGLQAQGVVRHIGLSTHTPSVANAVLDRGVIDMLMFPINPMYDWGQGDYANGAAQERQDLYRRCESLGVGISVMKPFSSGQLLDAAKSPFRRALTPAQCIQYALDKPGVLTVVAGYANTTELDASLAYLGASPEERDYSLVAELAPEEAQGRCVYCRHCHPCPAGLDIALINKYYDLSRQGDALAREHYLTLGKTARDCTGCGHCDRRCPFKVPQRERMQEIRAYFGR